MENSFKRLLSLVMVVLMVVSMMPTTVFAAETDKAVAKVGNTEYATIDEAIAAWTNGTTLTLLADVTLSDVIKLSSTEYHILDLGTYTMTAAKNKDAIQYVINGRSSAGYALDIKADATNPGGITATGGSVVRHTKPLTGAPSKDRPITRFYGGVFNASYVVRQGGTFGAGYTGASAPYFQFYGGEFNGTIYTNRSQNQFHGGTFNGSMQMSVDSSAYTLIAGGTFKNLSNLMGSELNSDKFTIGSAKGVYDKEVYIDDNGNYVIAAAEPAQGIEAAVATTPGTNDYLKYSKVGTEGVLKYTDATLALEKNKTATVTVYAEELDLVGTSFTGTIVVPEGHTLTITNAPDDLKTAGEGTVIIVKPVAMIGEQEYNTLQEALDAAVAGTGNVTVEILRDVDLTNVDWNPVTVSGPGYPLVTVNGNDKTITGLNDMLFASTWAGKSGLIINDLTIANSTIVNDENDTKGTVGVGAFIGYPQASAIITLNNCHLVDSTVSGGHWTGGLIGMAGGYNGNDGPVFMDLTITGCSVTGSTITGKGSAGGVMGHSSCNAWTNVVIEDTEVSGNTITSTGSSTNKAGSVMGTIGAAGKPSTTNGETKTGGTFVSVTTSGNTVTSNGTTITTIYGRQGTDTGMLTLTGGTYEAYPIEKNVSYAAPEAGYKIVENENGTYGLAECEYVAQVGDKKFESLQAAVNAAQSGDTVTLLTDIALTEADCVANADRNVLIDVVGKDITLDMNGKKISVVHEDAFTNDYIVAVIRVGDGAGLTVTGDGEIDVKVLAGNPDMAYMFWKRGTTGHLTIENGTYHMNDSADSMVYTNGHEIVTVKGGKFTLDATGTGENGSPWIFNVQGAGDHSVIVTGGTYNADINRQHWSNEAVVPKTHYVVKNSDNTWTVMEGAVAYVNEGMLTGPFFAPKDVGYATLQEALDAVKDEENIVINLLDDVTLDITAWQTLAIGGETTETITINGNGKTLTFNKLNSDWNHITTNNDAKLILNDMTITDSGKNNGPWNRYDLNFACDVKLNNVTSTKALAFKADATLNTVTVNETGDNYAIWIQANGQTVTIDRLTIDSAGRGIKIDNQYVDEAAKVTLSVSNATFDTVKKAAIMVKNPAGADITVSGVDISNVAADTVNVVWNDEDNVAYYNLVNVTGGTKAQEGEFPVAVKDAEDNILGYYKTLQAAIDAAGEGDTVELLWNEVDAPIAMNGAVFGKTVTITGTATVDWSTGNLFIGRGGEGDGTVIFEDANLISASNNASTGIHVSGREKDTNNKYDGTLIIKDSTIELDYLINKGTIELDNSSLTVKNGFSIGGRPASETESGEDATATITLNNGSKVIVNNHNGMGLGYEAIGVMNIDETSTFECTQSFLVTAKGTMNVNGTAKFSGTLTNKGSIVLGENATLEAAKLLLSDVSATVTAYAGMDIESGVEGYNVVYRNGVYSLVNEKIVAWNVQTGEEYETVSAALQAAMSGETVQLLADGEVSYQFVKLGVTLDLNGHVLTATYLAADFKGTHIIDSTDGKGRLVMDDYGSLLLNESNDYMAVKTAEGYSFYMAGLDTEYFAPYNDADPTDGNVKVYFALDVDNSGLAKVLQQSGGVNENIKFRVLLSWTNDSGEFMRYFYYTPEFVMDYAQDHVNLSFSLTLTGTETVTDLEVTAEMVLVDDAGKPIITVADPAIIDYTAAA